jgi:hypothetical protein
MKHYDCILINSENGLPNFFGQLLMTFTCTFTGVVYALALVLPLGCISLNSNHCIDQDFDLKQTFGKLQSHAHFIPIHSIIRGAYLIEDFEHPNQYLVNDTITNRPPSQ